MACGCVTVTNANEATRWLFKDGENCLLVEPVPNLVAARVGAVMGNPALLGQLRAGGLETTAGLDWEDALRTIAASVVGATP
jgi:glycosyltransferase involved in cell wall biosynthesis